MSEAFDSDFYRARYPDVARTEASPIHHYLAIGWREGRDPAADFSTVHYLRDYPDVRAAGLHPWVHYLQLGRSEGRLPRCSPLSTYDLAICAVHFDLPFYLRRYPELPDLLIEPISHYFEQGWREGRDPSPEFCTSYYLASNPDIDNPENHPFLHYIVHGSREKRRGKPPFYFHGEHLIAPAGIAPAHLALPVGAAPSHGAADAGPRIAVHLHVYYREGLDEILAQLRALPRRFDLFLTHCDPANRALLERAVAGSGLNCRLILLFCPNRGRDIAPLLIDLGRTLLDYDLALHLHVKKTVERETLGTQWLNDNLEKLLRDGRYVATLLDYFAFDQSCGILYPVPFEPIIPHMGWGPNRTMACAIMTRCGLDAALLPAQEPIFAAGSMFWFRPAALRPLFEANLRYDEFPSEPIAEDGTLAHAFERVFLYVAEGGGYGCRAIYPSNRQPLTADRPVDISVIIALGQEAATLERAIQSVLGQHDPQLAIEILLVESGGAGRNDRLAAFYQCHFPLLRHLQPICAALQLRPSEVIGACQGRYVAFLGAGAMLTLDSLPAMFQQGEASGALIIEGLRAEPRPIAPDETSILPYLPALPDQPYGKLFRCSFFLEQLDEGTDWPQLRFSASDQVTIARLCYVVD